MRNVKLERRAAEDRRDDKARRDAEIFAEVETGGTALRRRAEQLTDGAFPQLPTLGATRYPLSHQVDDIHPISALSKGASGSTDERRAAALQLAPVLVPRAAPSPGWKPG